MLLSTQLDLSPSRRGISRSHQSTGQLWSQNCLTLPLEDVPDQEKYSKTQPIRMYQAGTRAGNYQLAAMALAGLCATGSLYSIPQTHVDRFWRVDPTPGVLPGVEASNLISAPSPVLKLINEAQEISGLTLEFIAPLLGISRRAIQYWRDGGKASVRKEEQLRGLVDALKRLSTGSAVETRDLILARISGVPRIYDLLAERRYDAAVLRAKSPTVQKPILSDPTITFNHRPIEDQLAVADDGPAAFKGKLNRLMSRRILR